MHRWDTAPEIRRCNPLKWTYPESRRKLFEERDDARRDPRLKAAFQSYRLNIPSRDDSAVLLTVEDWELATSRPLGFADRSGHCCRWTLAAAGRGLLPWRSGSPD